MRTTKLILACAIAMAIVPIAQLHAQVQTIVPEPVPGAKPVAVEHIKIHGAALEAGNLQKARLSIAMPLSFCRRVMKKDMKRRYPVVYALHGFFIGAEQWTHEIHVATDR